GQNVQKRKHERWNIRRDRRSSRIADDKQDHCGNQAKAGDCQPQNTKQPNVASHTISGRHHRRRMNCRSAFWTESLRRLKRDSTTVAVHDSPPSLKEYAFATLPVPPQRGIYKGQTSALATLVNRFPDGRAHKYGVRQRECCRGRRLAARTKAPNP